MNGRAPGTHHFDQDGLHHPDTLSGAGIRYEFARGAEVGVRRRSAGLRIAGRRSAGRRIVQGACALLMIAVQALAAAAPPGAAPPLDAAASGVAAPPDRRPPDRRPTDRPPPGAAALPPHRPGFAPVPRVSSPRLYVIDCGTLIYNRPEDYHLTREEVADTNMAVPCFLVIHPKGLLLFDTGLPDRFVGRPVYENVDSGYGQIKFNTLRGQLADIGVAPEDITYLAVSHTHFDHVGNVGDYAGSIWLAQKTELDLIFGPHALPELTAAFAPFTHTRRLVIEGDHDVFGDGTVVLMFTPGHTPGHQSLYVKLAKTGGVVIAGDLYHYPEERTLKRMPPEEEPTATPASRARIEEFLIQNKAQLWIGHSIEFFRNAVKSPGWYE